MSSATMKTRLDLARYFAEHQYQRGAEIGVAEGRYSRILLECNPYLSLICVDPWQPSNGRGKDYQENAYQQAVENLSGLNAKIFRMTSLEASLNIDDRSLDFVFIDGAHDFDNVMLDIILWSRKVRKDGIVSGHDYMHFSSGNVVEAVDCYTEIHEIELHIIGRNRTAQCKDDRQPCWWFRNG